MISGGEIVNKNIEIPIWEKINLTIEEASCLFNIGEKAIREKTDEPSCDFVLFKGTHRLIKRKKFEEYIYSITIW